MWTVNPMTYLQHAWDGTSSWWGKVGLIMFYLFVWINIVLAIWTLIVPNSQGMDCLFDAADGNDDEDKTSVLLRGINWFMIWFLFYADKNGLHSWNVGIVMVVCISWWWMWMSYLGGSGEDESSCADIWDKQAWVWPVWTVVAFLFVLADEKIANHTSTAGTTEERQTLKA